MLIFPLIFPLFFHNIVLNFTALIFVVFCDIMLKNVCGVIILLCNRIQQFREYNKLEPTQLAEILNIDVELYNDYESGKAVPPIDIITKLAKSYKVTVDEFYGYTPRLTLHAKDDDFFDEPLDERILKMSDLSWEESKLILLYRNAENKDDILKALLNPDKNEK